MNSQPLESVLKIVNTVNGTRIEAETPLLKAVREVWPVVINGLFLLVIVSIFYSGAMKVPLTEGLIRVSIVVALYIFVGNSGILSFGHIAFMMIGAYASAWQTCCEYTRDLFFPGIPTYLLENTHPFIPAIILGGLLASFVALITGFALMRLSGIAASIGTFALLMIVYTVYLRWQTWTAGNSTVTGIPFDTNAWNALAFCVITMFAAFLYSRSKFGLALRSSREDEVAAKAAGVNVFGQRLLAFVISAFFAGVAGGFYGHFLGTITVPSFHLPLTFITLSMLVVGGMQSLSGAVIGTVAVTAFLQLLRWFETNGWIPSSSADVGLGIVLLLVLIFRKSGITGNAEIYYPFKPDASASGSLKRQS
tara:strand:+ start:4198 stop:5292 length:1095 start_codon:yes stop_codon:yes gene_type:complete